MNRLDEILERSDATEREAQIIDMCVQFINDNPSGDMPEDMQDEIEELLYDTEQGEDL